MSAAAEIKRVFLIGAGGMGREYIKVLQHLGVSTTVIGRSAAGTDKFFSDTGFRASPGGLTALPEDIRPKSDYAIVAVTVEELASTALELLNRGFRKILLEKPGGLNLEQIAVVSEKAIAAGAHIVLAYNRRFYASVLKAQEMIRADGGVRSFCFEFTEWPDDVRRCTYSPEVKQNWFLANSSHVADLAFFIGGYPREFTAFTAGSCTWHPTARIFSGAGIAEGGAIFSYQANWLSPGRWSVEIMTDYHRFIFRPLEKLQIQLNGSVTVEFVGLDDVLDREFKPGLYRQTDCFLSGTSHSNFIYIDQHCYNVANYYSKIISPQLQNSRDR